MDKTLIARAPLTTAAGRGIGSGDTFTVEAAEAKLLVENGLAEDAPKGAKEGAIDATLAGAAKAAKDSEDGGDADLGETDAKGKPKDGDHSDDALSERDRKLRKHQK